MPKLVNRAKMTTATTGTGTITLGSAVNGYQTFANAGVTNGNIVRYAIEDGNAWEIGLGTYSSTGTTLTRGTIESSTGTAINLSGNATVFVTAAAGDLQELVTFAETFALPTADGTNGQVLTTNGSGTLTFQSGGTVMLSSVDLSNVATVEFSLPTGYDYYTFAFGKVLPVTDNVEFRLLASSNGGSSYLSGYRNQLSFFRIGTVSTQSFSWSTGYVCNNNVGNATGEQGVSGLMTVMFPSFAKQCLIQSRMGSEDQNGSFVQSLADVSVSSDVAVNYIRFYFSSGNLSSGTITLYGHKS